MPTKTPSKPKKTESVTPSAPPETPQDLPDVATLELVDTAPSSVIERRVKLTDTSMTIAPETTYEEAISLYDFTHTIRERGRWWLGDIVNFMEDHFPEKYSQAIDLTGLSYSRLTTICSVCRKIEPSRRRKEASFTWHERIAYLPYQTADHLLDRAIKEKWTNEQFEDSVARAKGEPTKAEKRAAKEANPTGKSIAKQVAASGKKPQIPEVEKPLIWNGHPLRTAYAGTTAAPAASPASPEPAMPSTTLPSVESLRATAASAELTPESFALMKAAIESQCAATAQAIAERDDARDQLKRYDAHTAMETPLQRAEESILSFNAASEEVDWSKLDKLTVKKWLERLLRRSDEVIDVLMKQPVTPRK